MTPNSRKYLIWSALILAAFIVVICYASEIQVWFMAKLTWLIVLAITFVIGWLLGRYGGGRRRAENARGFTDAQK